MDTAPGPATAVCWHQALAYAVLGQRHPELGHQSGPNLPQFIVELDRMVAGGLDKIRTRVRQLRAAGAPWPHPVPSELMVGIGYAQFAAAMDRLLDQLELNAPIPSPVLTDRALTAEERRLADDVPPHHGS